LMTAIAIMAIMAGIAIPNYMEWSRAARLRSATSDLTSDLAMARLHAIKNSNSVKSLFSNGGYMIFIDSNNNNALDSGEVLLRNKQYPAGITGNSPTINFHRTGASSGGTATLSRGGNQQINIIVNLVGRIRVAPVTTIEG
jgi:type IV fimbrial biogenesis protein FimT